MLFLELIPNNPAIHKSIDPSSCGMTVKEDNKKCREIRAGSENAL
jgi:hypothetical protein